MRETDSYLQGVCNLADRNLESCLIEITDSGEDKGIDAIGVDQASSHVVVVQSKWRNDGKGSVDLGSILKFVNGVEGLMDAKGADSGGLWFGN